MVSRLSTVKLHASDYVGIFEDQSLLSFSWGCYQENFPTNDCPVSSYLNSGDVEFEASNLAPGSWYFELFVTDSTNNRKSRALVLLEVSWSDVPQGIISLLDSDGFRTQFNKIKLSPTSEIALISDAYPLKGITISYKWQETNSLLDFTNSSFTFGIIKEYYLLNQILLKMERYYVINSIYKIICWLFWLL